MYMLGHPLIQAWIDDQPDDLNGTQNPKKRKLANSQSLASKRPRRHLRVIDQNPIPEAGPPFAEPAQSANRRIIDKSTGKSSQSGKQKQSIQTNAEDNHMTKTKRTLRATRSKPSTVESQLATASGLPKSKLHAGSVAFHQTAAPATIETGIGASSAGSTYMAMLANEATLEHPVRPRSPSKKSTASSTGQAMRMGKDRVEFRPLKRGSVPTAAEPLYRKIQHYSQGQRILRKSADDTDFDPDDSLINTSTRYHDEAPLARRPPRQAFDDLVNRAATMIGRAHSEAAWNCDVHAPILRMGLSLSSKACLVDLCNITTASLTDDDYCPRTFLDLPSQQRKIDFAYTLQCPELSKTLALRGALPINATNYDPVLEDPLAVLIETKLEKMDDAKRQLSMWAFAQFRRWSGIFGERPPFLPLLSFLKGKAYVCFVEHRLVDNHGDQLDTIVYGEHYVGDVVSEDGALRVLATLAELARWAADELLPWMNERALKM